MCVSLAPAHFLGTVLCLAESMRNGRYVNTLVYRNRAKNLTSDGRPNAMLLHFPSAGMGPENIVDTSTFPKFVDDLVDAVKPPKNLDRALLSFSMTRFSEPHVFDHGIYTVVLAGNASDIPQALGRVREDRRPDVNQAVFDWYAQRFPGYSFALCCFNTRDEVKADPMMWWYEPNDLRRVMLPGIDAHTGKAPNLREDVAIDHWLILGSQERRDPRMVPVNYAKAGPIPPMARNLLPNYVVGKLVRGYDKNGDFVGPAHALAEGPHLLERGLLV